ncbi:alpha/beta fold hydrolase [Glycomyces rhizosphaerae]|uniref:Alpha/beta fold hydrolase n=1 Tax=Glycomyces rhizosphaerae TaxID=2054422 RepID=A0ABV7PXH9_9ACTN
MKDLFWRDTGSGRPLVFVHGGFLDHRMWDDQIPVFARDHRVIAHDARGHGRSANASGPFRHGDDLAAILRHLDTGPAVLVGLSMGGGIAIDVAMDHPELVEAVIVSGAGTFESHFADPWTIKVLEDFGTAIASGAAETAIEIFMRFTSGPSRTLEDVDPEVVRRLYEMLRGSFAKHTAGEPKWMLPSPDTWARAAQIGVPVHAINGAVDSPDHLEMAERLVNIVGTGTTTTIDGTAHYPNMERPQEFNAALQDMLRTL